MQLLGGSEKNQQSSNPLGQQQQPMDLMNMIQGGQGGNGLTFGNSQSNSPKVDLTKLIGSFRKKDQGVPTDDTSWSSDF